jgi:hypothetical protein
LAVWNDNFSKNAIYKETRITRQNLYEVWFAIYNRRLLEQKMALNGEYASKGLMASSGRLRSPTGYWSAGLENNKLWQMIATEGLRDVETIQHAFAEHVCTTLARTPSNMDNFGACQAAMYR